MNTEKTQYPFDLETQEDIVSLMFQSIEFLVACISVVKPHFFINTELGIIANTAMELYKKHKMPVTHKAVRVALSQNTKPEDMLLIEHRLQLLNKEIAHIEQATIKEQLITFARNAAVLQVARQIPTLMAENKADEITEQMRTALDTGKNLLDIGSFYFQDIERRIEKREQEFENSIATLIPEIDRCFQGGGLVAGDLGIMMAPTSMGKSFWLCHVAKAALIQRKKVMFYTLEMSEDQIGDRIDASFSGIKTRELRDNESELRKKISSLGSLHGNDSLLIKYMPIDTNPTVDTLRAHLTQCEGIGFIPEILVIDYADLFKGKGNYRGDTYNEQKSVYHSLFSLAGERQICIWTGSQAGKGALSKEFTDLEDSAESFAKVRIAPIVLTLSQTDKEAMANMIRVKIAKNRQDKSKRYFTIPTNYSEGSFYRIIE